MNGTRVRIKICGITCIEDAVDIAYAGADAIGLVFHPASPRHVSIEIAKQIAWSVPAFINVVGLFVDAKRTLIDEVLKYVPLDTLQFHGQEPEQDCALYNKPYIKAARILEGKNMINVVQRYPSASALLLDSYVDNVPGGTGTAFDWKQVPQDCEKPLILAGGLTPENVQVAIQQTRPYAVDVSSGVEAIRGKKDIIKVKAFIREALNA